MRRRKSNIWIASILDRLEDTQAIYLRYSFARYARRQECFKVFIECVQVCIGIIVSRVYLKLDRT